MRTPPILKAIGLALVLALPLPAMAIGTVSDGGVTFGYPTDFATVSGDTVNANLTGAAPGDQLFESWWFFRVSGDGQETAFATPDREDYTLHGGTTGALHWDDPNGDSSFRAALYFEVIETGPGQGVLFQNLGVTNTSGADLTIDIFHYSDIDIAGSFDNDRATLGSNPGGIHIDASDRTATAPLLGYGADAFQVTTYSSLRADLTDGALTDLDNTGLPFGRGRGADITAAFQWSLTLSAGTSENFLTQYGSDAPLQDPVVSVVPEPGPLVLAALGLAGLARYGRCRRAE